MINSKIYEKKAEKLKAIAHPYRLCIIKGLMEKQCNVAKIQECLGLPQSTVSQHLSKLKSAGIIEGEKEGQKTCYSVVDEETISIIDALFKENKPWTG